MDSEKIDIDEYFIQNAQDAIAFHSGLPIWAVSIGGYSPSIAVECANILNIDRDLFDFFHKAPVIEALTAINFVDSQIANFIKLHRNGLNFTSYSNHDPLAGVLKNIDVWRSWEFCWTLSATKHILDHNLDSGYLSFGGDWSDDGNNYEFGKKWKVRFFVDRKLNLIFYAGPFLHNVGIHDFLNEQRIVHNIVAGLRIIVSKFGTEGNQFELQFKMLARLAQLRPFYSLSELDNKLESVKTIISNLDKVNISTNNKLDSIDKPNFDHIPADHIAGLIGFIRLLTTSPPHQNYLALVYKMPELMDDYGKKHSDCWCIFRDGQFTFTKNEFRFESDPRMTNRLFAIGKDGQLFVDSEIKNLDTLLSAALVRVKRARNNFRNEQARIIRGALNALSGNWISHSHSMIKANNLEDMQTPWGIFHAAAPSIATLCFRMFRADIAHLYAYDDGPKALVHISSVHNNRSVSDPKICDSEIVDRSLLSDKNREDRINNSIAYRCLYDALDSYESERLENHVLWIKNYDPDMLGVGKGLVVTDIYRNNPRSEIAVELTAHGKVWGVIILTGYRAYQFEASTASNLASIGRLFSAQLFTAFFLTNLKRLADKILTIASGDIPNFKGLSTVVGQITLSSAVAFWVDLHGQDFYQAIDCYFRPDMDDHRRTTGEDRYVLKTNTGSKMARIISSFDNDDTVLAEWKISEDDDAPEDALEYLKSKKLNYAYIVSLKSASGSAPAFLSIHTNGQLSPAWKKILEFLSSYLGAAVQTLFERRREERFRIEAYSHTIRQLPKNISETEKKLSDHLVDKYKHTDPIVMRLLDDLNTMTTTLDQNLSAIFSQENKKIIPDEYINNNKNNHRLNDLISINKLLFSVLNKYPESDRNIGLLNMGNIGIYTMSEPIEIIILNLYENALKYKSKSSKIQISFMEGKNTIKIVFANLGSRLRNWEKNLIFGPGFRGSNSKHVESGEGYGLAICKRIATEWGVKIDYTPRDTSGFKTQSIFTESGEFITEILPKEETADVQQNNEWHVFSLIFEKYMVENIKEG